MTPWYEWVFSGAGVIALGAVVRFVYKRLSGKAGGKGRPITLSTGKNSPVVVDSPGGLVVSAPVTDSPVAVGTNITQSLEIHHHHSENRDSQEWTPTEPTPIQILREIDATLPFDREHAKQKYKDLKVVWQTSLSTVRADGHGLAVGTFFRKEGEPSVIVDFRLSSVMAELTSATEGSVLLVRGTIKSILGWAWGIDLKPDPKIRIVKRPLLYP
jgi:hypothetical protein